MAATLAEILDSHRTHRPIVMGVLNVTPDSFSDGGRFFDPSAAVEQARRMAAEGADVIDVGAESTRPGSQPVAPGEQIRRLRDVLPRLPGLGAVVSIDTTSAEVARFAIAAGARIINDVSAGREDPEIFPLAAAEGTALVLMHMLGQPRTMQADPRYKDVVREVYEFLAGRLTAATAAGVDRRKCMVDPGIGFGKRLEHNLALLAHMDVLTKLEVPVVVGASRKRFLGELTGQNGPDRRLAGTIAACVEAYRAGATVFRVHDVAPAVDALKVARAIHPAGGD